MVPEQQGDNTQSLALYLWSQIDEGNWHQRVEAINVLTLPAWEWQHATNAQNHIHSQKRAMLLPGVLVHALVFNLSMWQQKLSTDWVLGSQNYKETLSCCPPMDDNCYLPMHTHSWKVVMSEFWLCPSHQITMTMTPVYLSLHSSYAIPLGDKRLVSQDNSSSKSLSSHQGFRTKEPVKMILEGWEGTSHSKLPSV